VNEMIVKQLPKGVPQGYQPPRQTPKVNVRVMVSEYTRRVAHELDTLHRDWIIRRQCDELIDLHESPFANGGVPLDHLDWLVQYESSDDRYRKVVERRMWLQNELGNIRRSRMINGKFLNKPQFLTHYEALKLEWVYCVALQSRLLAMQKARKDYVQIGLREKLKALGDVLRDKRPEDHTLHCLIELRSALSEWLASTDHPDMSERLQCVMDGSQDHIRSLASELVADVPDVGSDEFTVLDSFFARNAEKMDSKTKPVQP
jgi:hypothetical protein